MQNVFLVTMSKVWTLMTNDDLVYKPHLRFLAQNLSKKVQLIHKPLQYLQKLAILFLILVWLLHDIQCSTC